MKPTSLKVLIRIFKILSNESGLKIFLLLSRKRELCVSDISKKIGLSISAISHQLQKIEAAGLIDSFRTGRTICYTFRANQLTKDLGKCINDVISKKGRQSIYESFDRLKIL